MSFTLTDDQQRAYNAFCEFLSHPDMPVLRITGYAGTGKSTLIRKIREDLTKMLATNKLLTQSEKDWNVALTATTNKAAQAFAEATNEEVSTIHSFLGLRLNTNYKTRTTTLETTPRSKIYKDYLIFIDEASYIDETLLGYIYEFCSDCKIVFIGDPAQLAPIKSRGCPVYQAAFPEVCLTKVIRQAEGNPIIDLATAFRDTVNGHGWLEGFQPDGQAICNVSRDEFSHMLEREFDRSDWHHSDSKILAYTNKTVQRYNQAIRDMVQGDPELQVHDYATVNQAVISRHVSLKTDQTVYITNMIASSSRSVPGWDVTLDHKHDLFLPLSLELRKARIKKARQEEDFATQAYIDSYWVDLRATYACTINKSQGSTFDRVFIDLDDLRTCRNPNTLARLLYVAVSRAREQVVLTGDLVAKETTDVQSQAAVA